MKGMVSSLLAAVALPISTATLLAEASDPVRLASPSNPAYRTVQASSYDRRSIAPGQDSWFANDDFGGYVREESREGRREFVMADWTGPGALVRLWSANPVGTVRFYFDGEASPRLSGSLPDLLSGSLDPLTLPLGYRALRAGNSYWPLPFSKGLKITVEGPPEARLDRMYYLANARLYAAGTPVATWSASDVSAKERLSLARALRPLEAAVPFAVRSEAVVSPGARIEVSGRGTGPGMVERWGMSLAAEGRAGQDLRQAWHRLEGELSFDGRVTARAPMGAFFGSAVVPAEGRTWMASLAGTTGASRLPLPYRDSWKLAVVNRNPYPVRVTLGAEPVATGVASPWVLRGSWVNDFGSSRPFRDMVFLDASGGGRYVGTVMHIQNPSAMWWGEGDEKVWVDGEPFPSWFGTGTEDYFGYAWSDPNPFSALYHAQPASQLPNNRGHISNVRWHVLDDIPFARSLRFAMEMWHWDKTDSRFSGLSLWYGPPPASDAAAVSPGSLELLELGVRQLAGALEGEDLVRVGAAPGVVEAQRVFAQNSGGAQLWWRDAPVGSRLVLEVPSRRSGRFRLVMSLCFAPDYGRHEVFVNGASLGVRDFYSASLKWEEVDFGMVGLRSGVNLLEVVAQSPNPEAEPRNMFGLDYLLLAGGLTGSLLTKSSGTSF